MEKTTSHILFYVRWEKGNSGIVNHQIRRRLTSKQAISQDKGEVNQKRRRRLKFVSDRGRTSLKWSCLCPPYPLLLSVRQEEQGRRISCSALPETAASVALAATIVGAASVFIVRKGKAPKETEISERTCEDCGGSGICSECNGEGFVLKKLSEESAERARTAAKNMATRFTAGLPKKWSYCTKCSSSRSCTTCGGRGKLSF